ncbi:MAG: caspase family protein [Candidatus Thermoplasmatota archaeon]|nr:caspase family protein [Candidatus Thermoplasmatota archaeon]
MKRNHVFLQIVGVSIVLLLLSSTTISPVFASEHQRNNEQKDNSASFSSESQFYAVIAGCAQYQDPQNNLPISDEKLLAFYDSLSQSDNWNTGNIIVLLNKNATKQNITAAFSYMTTIVGPDDYFLFQWCGHGTQVPDLDGDEQTFNHNDTKDEAICPYDTRAENHTLINVITDDELDSCLSAILCKGMCVILECCLSGGMVDETKRNISIDIDTPETTAFSTEFSQDLQKSDVNGDNRIVLMSTRPNHLGRAILLTGFSLIHGMAFACRHSRLSDRNHDGIISVEEAFTVARPLVWFQSSIIWIGAWFYEMYIFKHIYSIPVGQGMMFFSGLAVILTYLIVQHHTQEKYGYPMGNYPMMRDDYPGDFPLIFY